jgi:hypothetical protein
MLRFVVLVRIDISEELSASFIRVTKIGELGTTLAVTSNRCKLLGTANLVLSSLILTLITGALRSSKNLLLQEPRGVTSQKTAFFIIAAVKT